MKLDNRMWIILTVLVSGAVLAGAWFLGVSPFLGVATATRAQLAQVESTNGATSAELTALKKEQAEIDSLQNKAGTLTSAVPHGLDATRFIDQVNSIASGSGVDVKSITVSAAAAYAPTAPQTAGTPGEASTPTPSASPTTEAAPEPTGPVGPSPVVDPLITSSNFVVVPVTIVVTGSGAQTLDFLEGLQHGKRLVLVTSINTEAGDGGNADLTIGGAMYVLKKASATTTAATTG